MSLSGSALADQEPDLCRSQHYWVPDSDAVNSMDPYEAALWFETRGDQCVNCPGGIDGIMGTPGKPVIRVKLDGEKSGG